MKALEWIADRFSDNPINTVIGGSIAAVVIALAAPPACRNLANEKDLRREFAHEAVQASTLESSLSVPVSMHAWNPIDITERIKKGMDYFGTTVLFEPETDRGIKGIPFEYASANGNWWVSMTVRSAEGGRFLSSAFLQSEFPFVYKVDTYMLFDSENKRIYALTWGDLERAGIPGSKPVVAGASPMYGRISVADNGTCAYTVISKEVSAKDRGNKPSYARVIADFSGQRKYVMPIICLKPPIYPMVELSDSGDRAIITENLHDLSKYTRLDVKSGKIEMYRKPTGGAK